MISPVRVVAIGVACLACIATSSARPKEDEPLTSAPAAEGLGGAAGLGTVGTAGPARWCAQDAPPVTTSAPPAIVTGVRALLALDARALADHVQPHLQARLERAMTLHDASAPPYTEVPLDPITAAPAEVHRVLAPARTCPSGAAIVADELRIDFPPAFEDTRAENAAEIGATHDELYAGTSVTLYCGPCAVAALVLASPLDAKRGAVVLAWDDLAGGVPPNQ